MNLEQDIARALAYEGGMGGWPMKFAWAEQQRVQNAIEEAKLLPANWHRSDEELYESLMEWVKDQGYGTYTECMIANSVKDELTRVQELAASVGGYPITYSVRLRTCGAAPAVVG